MEEQRLPLLGLNALARAHTLNYFTDGHRGAAILSAHWLCVDNELDAFVFNRAVLAHLVKTEFPVALQILPDHFDPYYVGIAVLPGSELREPMDRALLQIMADDSWARSVASYVGTGSHD